LINTEKVTVELLDAIQDAFNRRDVDGILSYFSDDCEWLMARGPDPWEGKRLRGKPAIAEVLSARFAVIPDMRWVDMSHFISPDGSKACSEWTVNKRVGNKERHILEIHRVKGTDHVFLRSAAASVPARVS